MTQDTWNDIVKNGAYSQELDWFAIDNKGQLGMFSAAMNAPIPDKVMSSLENYEDLKRLIELAPKITSAIVETREQGNFDDWIAYAEKGLFAFDFQDIHRIEKRAQYDLIARPLKPLTLDELNLPTNLNEYLVRINCDFGSGNLETDKVK